MSYAYNALKDLWNTLSGSQEEKLAIVNAKTVEGPNVDVSTSSVFAYLALHGKLSVLESYANNPPVGANTTAVMAAKQLFSLVPNGVTTITMSNPIVHGVVSTWLTAFVADGTNTGITENDRTALLALSSTTTPWWQYVGLTGFVTEPDLANAGLI